MLPSAISSTKSNSIAVANNSIVNTVPFIASTTKASVKLVSPLKEHHSHLLNNSSIKSGGRYSALNSKIDSIKRRNDGSPPS